MTKVKQLEKFIKENKLEFNSGSGGDVNVLALCGYACYIQASEEDCIKAADTDDYSTDKEIRRVYQYADTHNYDKWWNTSGAKAQWKF